MQPTGQFATRFWTLIFTHFGINRSCNRVQYPNELFNLNLEKREIVLQSLQRLRNLSYFCLAVHFAIRGAKLGGIDSEIGTFRAFKSTLKVAVLHENFSPSRFA